MVMAGKGDEDGVEVGKVRENKGFCDSVNNKNILKRYEKVFTIWDNS